MVARTVSGGFGGSQWSQTGDPWFQLDIYQRFDAARRNDDGSMHDHLKMYKDCVVVIFGQRQRVRVSGFFAIDCHGLGSDCGEDVAAMHNAEIHPVYAIDLFQDFNNNRSAIANLSGVWHCATDVSTYYLRQDGQEVWWFGISRDDGNGFANVFRGTLQGDLPTGSAIDLPLRVSARQDTAELSITCQGGTGGVATRLVSNGPAWEAHQWEKIYDTMPFPVPVL